MPFISQVDRQSDYSLIPSSTPIVIDNGGSYFRIGWGGESDPRVIFRNIVQRPRHKHTGKLERSDGAICEVCIGIRLLRLEVTAITLYHTLRQHYGIRLPYGKALFQTIFTEYCEHSFKVSLVTPYTTEISRLEPGGETVTVVGDHNAGLLKYFDCTRSGPRSAFDSNVIYQFEIMEY
ncbi:hypothetical protein KSS87_023400, partial [Heliosperma pusillum]